jgi:pectinesterase
MRKRALLILLISVLLQGDAWGQTLSDALMQQADIVVDIHGSGNYKTVQAGIDAIPDYNDQWKVILVKKGIYHEKVILNYKKTKVILVGEDVDSTIITHDDWGDKMLVDGDPAVGGHTFSTYTFRADPHEFQAYNITFENPTHNGQGVAFHSNGDKQILFHCRLLGYQDTYFDNFRTRRYMKDCFIMGNTDFIFGFGVTLFDSCQIHAVEGGYLTASSTPQYYEFGHVFKDCRVTSDFDVSGGVYLGRPWFPYANTIFYECWLPEAVTPGGWQDWSGRGATCIYREYNNSGPGSDTTDRIDFAKQLDPSRADRYNIDTILAASNFPSGMGEVVDSMELWSMRNRFEASGYPARADTVLYAGRDYWPEYPTDDWSPAYYDSIYSIIREYTVPFMDSINGHRQPARYSC